MALIKCPECNKEISDTVDFCIHCGYKINKSNNLEDVSSSSQVQSKKNPLWIIIGIILLLIGLLWGIADAIEGVNKWS